MGCLLCFMQEDNDSKSFFFKHVQCELCKTPFPSAVIANGTHVPIIEVPRVEAPFIILENMGGVRPDVMPSASTFAFYVQLTNSFCTDDVHCDLWSVPVQSRTSRHQYGKAQGVEVGAWA